MPEQVPTVDNIFVFARWHLLMMTTTMMMRFA